MVTPTRRLTGPALVVPATFLAGLLLFSSGAAAALALRAGVYATALALALAAICVVTIQILHAARTALKPPGTEPARAPPPAPAEEEHRLRAMLDNAPAAFITLAVDGTLRAINKAARALFKTDDRIVGAPGGLRGSITGSATDGGNIVKLAHGSDVGRERAYALSVVRTSASDGALWLAVLTDVQGELFEAEAAAMRDMLQVLSHEIMNSLTPVTSLVETAYSLSAEATPGDGANLPLIAQALQTALRRAHGIDRFVQGYRTLARLPAPRLRPGSVAGLLRDAAALFEARWAGAGVVLTLSVPVPDLIVQLDTDLMTQALLNLLSNAAEAVLSAPGSERRVELSGHPCATGVNLLVADTGGGITPDRQGAIFQPFFTSKENGTGIGLSLARQIALGHGGMLALDPDPPDGRTVFRLTL